MANIDKLAKSFGLEEYRDFKVENGNIYVISENNFGQQFWLFFAKTTAYKSSKRENWVINMLKDIKKDLRQS